MSYILAIDAGTTGITCLLLDQERVVVGRGYEEFAQHYPQPGWVEHDAVEIWETTKRVAKAACSDAGVTMDDVAAIGITNQRETTVVWNRATGEPIHRAIVWQDRRTSATCAALRPQWQDKIRAKTGLVLDPYFSATKIAWILDNVEGARAAVADLAAGTIDTWLTWKLTEGKTHATDDTNASRTLLWNISEGSWDQELLELFRVPSQLLPEVRSSAADYGVASALGTTAPVAALVGDQQSALFGQGCTRPGEAKNTYGTGCFLLQHTGTTMVASNNGLLTTRAASLDGSPQFALEGSVFVGGAAIQWLRDGLAIIADAPAVNDLAAEAGNDAGGVVVVPAFAGLGAPYWDSDARGAVFGITRGTTKAHIARATLEAIALQSYDLLSAMEKDSGYPIPELHVDGGATNSQPLMQFQADIMQRPVVRPAQVETTALGAAYLAGIQAGVWGLEDLRQTGGETRFTPAMANDEAQDRLAVWHHAVAATRTFKPQPAQ